MSVHFLLRGVNSAVPPLTPAKKESTFRLALRSSFSTRLTMQKLNLNRQPRDKL